MKSILCDAQLLTIMDKRAHAVSKDVCKELSTKRFEALVY